MEYSDILAATCVAAKQAADLNAVRSEFEASSGREKVLRDYIDRMQGLASERAAVEPQGVTDYIGAGLNKMVSPIPSSLPELGIRGIGAGVGAALGSTWGEGMTGSTPEVISGVVGKLPDKGGKSLMDHVRQRLGERGIPASGAGNVTDNILEQLKKISPSDASRELINPRLGTSASKGLGEALNKAPGYRAIVREELLNAAKQLGDKFELPKRWTIGGGIAGALAGGAVAGLPFAIKALYDKMRGGEGAVSARAKAREALEEANALQAQREKLLRGLKA